MRKAIVFCVVSLLLLVGTWRDAKAGVKFGFSIGDESLEEFYFAVVEYYGVTDVELGVIKQYVPTEEIPVLLFIARKGRVAPTMVMDLRRTGMRWIDIMRQLRISPEAIYVPVKKDIRELSEPPYGRAYGYYKDTPKKEWDTIILRDTDVINLVNLKFMVDYHKREPEEIIKLKSGKKSFITINAEVEKRKKKEALERRKEGEKKKVVEEKVRKKKVKKAKKKKSKVE